MDGSQRPTLNADLTYICASGHAHIHICPHEHTYKGKEERNKGRGREREGRREGKPDLACYPSTWETEMEGSGVQSQAWQHSPRLPWVTWDSVSKGGGRDENDHLFLSHGNLIPSETAIIFICVYQLIFPLLSPGALPLTHKYDQLSPNLKYCEISLFSLSSTPIHCPLYSWLHFHHSETDLERPILCLPNPEDLSCVCSKHGQYICNSLPATDLPPTSLFCPSGVSSAKL